VTYFASFYHVFRWLTFHQVVQKRGRSFDDQLYQKYLYQKLSRLVNIFEWRSIMFGQLFGRNLKCSASACSRHLRAPNYWFQRPVYIATSPDLYGIAVTLENRYLFATGSQTLAIRYRRYGRPIAATAGIFVLQDACCIHVWCRPTGIYRVNALKNTWFVLPTSIIFVRNPKRL